MRTKRDLWQYVVMDWERGGTVCLWGTKGGTPFGEILMQKAHGAGLGLMLKNDKRRRAKNPVQRKLT